MKPAPVESPTLNWTSILSLILFTVGLVVVKAGGVGVVLVYTSTLLPVILTLKPAVPALVLAIRSVSKFAAETVF